MTTNPDPFEAAFRDYFARQQDDPTRQAIAHRDKATAENDQPDALTRAVIAALNKGRPNTEAVELNVSTAPALNSEALENNLRANLGA